MKGLIYSLHIAIHRLLHSIALENYEKYENIANEYNLLTNNNEQWDLLTHTPQENEKYFTLFREKTKHAIISVVFFVMSIEGLINEYAVVYLGQDRFMELERKRITEKIVTCFYEVTKRDFPTDRPLYQRINELVAVRNTLVHNKSTEIDISVLLRNDDEAEDLFYGYINSMFGNSKAKPSKQKGLESVLKKSHTVYQDLMKYLNDTLQK